MFYIYILRTSSNTLYIGQTNNLERRLEEHKNNKSKSAKYIRYFSSFDLVYKEMYSSRKGAMQREYQLKKWPRVKKEALIKGNLKLMTKKYYHQKLIRDRIPEIIKASGDTYSTRVLGKKEFEKELKKKLVEESQELAKAPKESLLNELADVLELTKSIASHFHIPFSILEKYQAEKRRKRGGFKKKLFLVWSTGKAGK